jgi:hypothetical protein
VAKRRRQRFLRAASAVAGELVAVACGSQSATDAPSPPDAATDAQDDASAVREDADAGVAPDAYADSTLDADARDSSPSAFCSTVDARTVLVCETFDDGSAVPPPFASTSDIPTTVEVTSVVALSPPNAVATSFVGDAGYDYNSATGAAIRASFGNGLPRARLSFSVRIDGTFDGEVDVAQLTWSASPADTYWLRFGTNTGLFWKYESTGYGSLSITSFPTGAWYRVVVEVDLAAKHVDITVGGVVVFDGFLAPSPTLEADAAAANAVELALGAPAASTHASAPAVVYVDDVLLTDF